MHMCVDLGVKFTVGRFCVCLCVYIGICVNLIHFAWFIYLCVCVCVLVFVGNMCYLGVYKSSFVSQCSCMAL